MPKLDANRYGVLLRAMGQEVKLFRAENVALQTQATKLDQSYSEISGAMVVNFDGEEKTLPQMARYLEDSDRAKREASWRAVAERRQQDCVKVHDIYSKLITLRDQMGRNAGFDNFRDFQHQRPIRHYPYLRIYCLLRSLCRCLEADQRLMQYDFHRFCRHHY